MKLWCRATGLALWGASSWGAALVVPMAGWTPIAGDASQWKDSAETCLIREDHYGQAFPELTSSQTALTIANKLRATLSHQGFNQVVTQPVERRNNWGVLATYGYQEGGVAYQVLQLFLSQRGSLRTVSGSAELNTTASCTAALREFIRYQAN